MNNNKIELSKMVNKYNSLRMKRMLGLITDEQINEMIKLKMNIKFKKRSMKRWWK